LNLSAKVRHQIQQDWIGDGKDCLLVISCLFVAEWRGVFQQIAANIRFAACLPMPSIGAAAWQKPEEPYAPACQTVRPVKVDMSSRWATVGGEDQRIMLNLPHLGCVLKKHIPIKHDRRPFEDPLPQNFVRSLGGLLQGHDLESGAADRADAYRTPRFPLPMSDYGYSCRVQQAVFR